VHDALVKPMPGKNFAPSLAESYEIAPDFKSATFKLRSGVKFHDGSPVTPDDVKFTYEQYRGASATVLKAKLERIELPDDRTVRFIFKEPFVDFLTIYGSPASGAAWIVPKAYYEKVGKDGFKTAPMGPGRTASCGSRQAPRSSLRRSPTTGESRRASRRSSRRASLKRRRGWRCSRPARPTWRTRSPAICWRRCAKTRNCG